MSIWDKIKKFFKGEKEITIRVDKNDPRLVRINIPTGHTISNVLTSIRLKSDDNREFNEFVSFYEEGQLEKAFAILSDTANAMACILVASKYSDQSTEEIYNDLIGCNENGLRLHKVFDLYIRDKIGTKEERREFDNMSKIYCMYVDITEVGRNQKC